MSYSVEFTQSGYPEICESDLRSYANIMTFLRGQFTALNLPGEVSIPRFPLSPELSFTVATSKLNAGLLSEFCNRAARTRGTSTNPKSIGLRTAQPINPKR